MITHPLYYPGGLTEPLELVAQDQARVFIRRNGEIVVARADTWQRLVQSGSIREVGRG
ncbi:hypothetical protein K6L44_06695 [Gluconacetobacter entanii]|uniref:hypothetical protein n=1 Tax=Gluconacetobacter entanii TaxID=108528 RepID=UPI001C9356A6|nr:hypothetical protein [Gluconacetobacter entanii]MBY4639689.1 hypothetical protein [Gluconacetobacter entanii]MCW4579184.1 hypothetical protein [Gluconacetobacter entanii]MCW4582574.1 hypothetical protein [Gluconacetobacter entanii]MCW4585977.1 hypothetical protein [Gluconacetobacter entanii]